jgi:glycosyltransferase involved in cell wall biosynthesis
MLRRRRVLLESADGISSATGAYAAAALRDLPAVALDRPPYVCHLGAYLAEYPDPPRPDPLEVPSSGVDPRPLACVYAGSLEQGQDLDTVFAAARRLSAAGTAVDIHVAGTGKLESRLKADAATIPGPARVVVHGLLPRGAYAKLLSECDAGLVAVKPESLVAVPYKACDYAAAGLALVNALPGELADLIDTHRAGLPYVAGDPQSLADVLTTLAADCRFLLELRQGARRLAEDAFDRERTYPRFAHWLESLAG